MIRETVPRATKVVLTLVLTLVSILLLSQQNQTAISGIPPASVNKGTQRISIKYAAAAAAAVKETFMW